MRHLLLSLLLSVAAVLPVQEARAAARCSVTPTLAVQNYPGAASVSNSNNLMQPTGKSVASEGQQVVIAGTLLDKNCVPVQDARIELWQVNPFGKWMLATREDLVNPNPVFTGAGRTYSANDGSFYFITAFPSALPKRAPHFNLKIKVRGLREWNSVLYVAADGRNEKDAVFARLAPDKREAISLKVSESDDASLRAAITLVLPEAVRYRGY